MKTKYTFPHKSRKEIREYFEEIGGYKSSFYSYPLAFNVKLYDTLNVADLNTIWKAVKDQYLEQTGAEKMPWFLKHVFNAIATEEYINALYWSVIEDMRDDVNDTDTWNWNGKEHTDVVYTFTGRSTV